MVIGTDWAHATTTALYMSTHAYIIHNTHTHLLHIRTHIRTYPVTTLCTYTCTYIRTYVRTYAYLGYTCYVYMYVRMRTHIRIHTHTHTHTYTHTHTHTLTAFITCTVSTYIHKFVAKTHKYVSTYVHACFEHTHQFLLFFVPVFLEFFHLELVGAVLPGERLTTENRTPSQAVSTHSTPIGMQHDDSTTHCIIYCTYVHIIHVHTPKHTYIHTHVCIQYKHTNIHIMCAHTKEIRICEYIHIDNKFLLDTNYIPSPVWFAVVLYMYYYILIRRTSDIILRTTVHTYARM